MNTTIKDITVRWRLIVASMVIFALIAFIISTILPAKYQSDISMIVVQKQSSEKVDAFSATKSAEFLSNIFSNVIYTTSFFNSVQDAPFEVKRDFSHDPEERERQWENFIDVKKVNNTGIINISVFDTSRTTAEETAKAIAYILTTNSEEYHGGGERVDVRLIDGPNTPLRPTVPHILQNTIVGAIIGIILAIVFVYFFPEKFILSRKEVQNEFTLEKEDDATDLAGEYYSKHVDHEEAAASHFKNVEGTITFDNENEKINDPEVDALHERISNFNQSNA